MLGNKTKKGTSFIVHLSIGYKPFSSKPTFHLTAYTMNAIIIQ